MDTPSDSDDKLRLFSDQVGGDKIQSGDIAGSVAAIGEGANVIFNKVERALTQIESREQADKFEKKRLADALTDYVLRLEQQATLAKEDPRSGNPYKALLEFDIQDAALFYGRSKAIHLLLAHIERDQLTVLHAESGVGKTSLLKAGILPRLLADGHVPIYLRPYQIPVHLAIKQALLLNFEDTPSLASLSLHDFLLRVTSLISGRQLVVIVDQFEELFTVQDEVSRKEFIDHLSICLDDDLLPVRWILATRDEWFGQLGTFRPRIRNPYANELLLHPLSRNEANLVIIQPAERRQVSYEHTLVESLLDDLGKDEIAPPDLQLVCSSLFDLLDGRTEITQAMYEDAGKASGILRQYLHRVLSRDVPRDMRAPARRLLEALVTSEKRRALRTREDLTAELAGWGYSSSIVDGVVNHLIDSHLLRSEEFMLDKGHSVIAYELAHDYLLDEINIDPEVQARKAAQELLTQKLPYYKRENLLLSPHELSIILPQRQWLTLSEDATALLRDSQAVIARQRRMKRAGIATAILLLIGAIALIAVQRNVAAERYETIASTAVAAEAMAEKEANTAVAAEARAEAQANTAVAAEALAETQANISLARKLAGDTELAKSLGQTVLAYEYAAESYRTAHTLESRSALYTALSLPLPESIISIPVDVVTVINFSPKSDRMVFAGSDNKARIWDVDSAKELFTLEGHEALVTFAAFNPDGTRIVTASGDGTIGIWDAQNGNAIQIIPAHERRVTSASFSRDGSRIVTASGDRTAAIWDATTGEKYRTLEGHEDIIRYADFSPDGSRIVTASDDSTARVWTLNGVEIFELEGHTGRVNYAAFNPDGTRIVTVGVDRTGQLWDAETGKSIAFLVPHNGEVNSANFSPDGRFIVTTSEDHLVRLWDSTNGTLLASFPGHTDQVNWASFSPDGKWIATVGNDAKVWLRGALQIAGSASFFGHTGDINSVNFSNDGMQIVTASADRTAWVWDVRSNKQSFALEGHDRGVNFAVFSPDGTRIATAGSDETVRLWNAEDGNELYKILIPESAWSVKFNPDGSHLVTAGIDGIARVWDAQTGKELLPALEGHLDDVNYASFSPDGTRIVTVGGTDDGSVRIWDSKTHEELSKFTIISDNEVNSANFSPDGKQLVIAADEGVAQVWDVERGKLIFQLVGHESDVKSASFSPDGQLIVTTSDDHTLRLWDAVTGERLATLQGHTDEVGWATFSPDGKWIFSASNDRTVRTWMVNFDDLNKYILDELDRLGIN